MIVTIIMGEAKRRKRLNSNYGKVFSLRTESQREEHISKMMNEFIDQFETQFKALAEADSIPDNFSSITSEIKNWFQQELAKYDPSDHTMLSETLLFVCAEMNDSFEMNPLTMVCFVDALSPYLSLERRQKLANLKAGILADFAADSSLPTQELVQET